MTTQTGYLEEVGRHFDGTRHGGIRLPNMTAITNEVIRQTFPEAVGVAVRGSSVAVIYAQCQRACGAPLCNHPKDDREEVFTGDEIDALILAHVRGARVEG